MSCTAIVLLLMVAVRVSDAFFTFTPTTKVATFNTALIPPYGQLEERREILTGLIIASDIDILCLQEVWQTDNQRFIYNAVSRLYPYAVSAVDLTQTDTSQSGPACSLEFVQEYGQCVQDFCENNSDTSLFVCATIECGSLLPPQSLECRGCISLNTLAFQVCATEPAARYETTYGLLLLSRRRLTNTAVEGFLPESEFRGCITASVEDVGDIVCTHLTADLGPVYFGGPLVNPLLFTTYAEQQYNELLQLFDFVTSSESPILLGDFNNGPASPGNITWEFPFNYGALVARGLTSPYVLLDGRCTFCVSSNPAAAATFSADVLIDHVFLPTTAIGRVVSTTRIWDSITTSVGLPLSDHYGVEMVLRENRRCRWRIWRYVCEDITEELSYLPLPPPQQRLADLCQAV